MRRSGEDIPARFGASIDEATAWAPQLASACHDAAQAPAADALEVVLRHLREAAGAERAFLLEAAPPKGRARVVAASASRQDDAVAFSTSVAARALRGERPLFFADVRREPVWAEGVSVRALALRAALAAPLRACEGRRAAIVLDSRAPLALDAAAGLALVRVFAGLISLLRHASPVEHERKSLPASGQVGRSPAFLRLQDDVAKAARVPLPALVVGESGSGKELVARALHEGGARARRPFVAINCAAIPEALLERELFGATRGAYTGADRDHPGLFRQADGGTVFLDEIGDMPLSLQAKLLRVLQEGELERLGSAATIRVDVRVIAATNADLEQRVAEGKFREDLYYRLTVIRIHVPPLRERREEVPHLCALFLREACERLGKPDVQLSAEALDLFSHHWWPGNVRQLRNEIQRAVALSGPAGLVGIDQLSPGFAALADDAERPTVAGRAASAPDLPLSLAVEQLEREMIQSALRRSAGNVSETARTLGLTRRGLYLKMRRLGVDGGPGVDTK